MLLHTEPRAVSEAAFQRSSKQRKDITRPRVRLIFDTILLGIVGALGTQLFTLLLEIFDDIFLHKLAGYYEPRLPNEGGQLTQVISPHGMWLVLVAIVLGGLISGFIIYTWAPEAEGHGTDTAVKAFHKKAGRIRKRVTPLKILASAITIGSGGAAGREGPTALFKKRGGDVKRSDLDCRGFDRVLRTFRFAYPPASENCRSKAPTILHSCCTSSGWRGKAALSRPRSRRSLPSARRTHSCLTSLPAPA